MERSSLCTTYQGGPHFRIHPDWTQRRYNQNGPASVCEYNCLGRIATWMMQDYQRKKGPLAEPALLSKVPQPATVSQARRYIHVWARYAQKIHERLEAVRLPLSEFLNLRPAEQHRFLVITRPASATNFSDRSDVVSEGEEDPFVHMLSSTEEDTRSKGPGTSKDGSDQP